MKRKFEIFMVVCLLVTSFVLARESASLVHSSNALKSSLCIVLDAGHGGSDPGKVGVNQVLEKDVNLSIVLKLKPLLENKNITPLLCRENDKMLCSSSSRNKKVEDLQNRVKMISESDAAITVSIHQNSFPDSSVCGPQVFYYSQSVEGKELAEYIQNSLNTKLKIASPRQCKANDNYYLLKKTPTPTVIVECGFLSNPTEASLLIDDTYQNKLARAIYLGITDYLLEKNMISDGTDINTDTHFTP